MPQYTANKINYELTREKIPAKPKPNFDHNYIFPIDLAANRIQFGVN